MTMILSKTTYFCHRAALGMCVYDTFASIRMQKCMSYLKAHFIILFITISSYILTFCSHHRHPQNQDSVSEKDQCLIRAHYSYIFTRIHVM